MKNALTIVGTALAALAASACCWVPALLGAGAAGSLGLGAALAPYRPYLLGVTAIFLIAGFTMVYRKPGEDCCSAAGCLTDAAQRKRWTNIGVMWTIAVFAIAMAAYPYIAEAQLARKNAAVSATNAPGGQQLAFSVQGMDCAACAAPIQEHVEKVPGVESATIDFDSETLVVHTGKDVPSEEAILAAVADAGFTATKK
jgi:copper chaperone CopZ